MSETKKPIITEYQATRLLNVFDYAVSLVKRDGYWNTEVIMVEDKLSQKFYKYMNRSEFFREYVFVVFCSGFRTEVVEKRWDEFFDFLYNFDVDIVKDLDIESIIDRSPIKNRMKLKAIIDAAAIITREFLLRIRTIVSVDEIRDHLLQLPYIGNITVWHLMRNIGFDCYKPDRHLVKLSEIVSIPLVDMFDIILDAGRTEYIGVADVVLWRACATLGSADMLVKKGGLRDEHRKHEC